MKISLTIFFVSISMDKEKLGCAIKRIMQCYVDAEKDSVLESMIEQMLHRYRHDDVTIAVDKAMEEVDVSHCLRVESPLMEELLDSHSVEDLTEHYDNDCNCPFCSLLIVYCVHL